MLSAPAPSPASGAPLDLPSWGADGSLTLNLQHEGPDKELEAHWLPAPNGQFYVLLCRYWPKESFLSGAWTTPRVGKATSTNVVPTRPLRGSRVPTRYG